MNLRVADGCQGTFWTAELSS